MVLEMVRAGEYREKEPLDEPTVSWLFGPRTAGQSIRPEVLGDKRLECEPTDLLVLAGIVEVPDESSPPGELSSAERTEPH